MERLRKLRQLLVEAYELGGCPYGPPTEENALGWALSIVMMKVDDQLLNQEKNENGDWKTIVAVTEDKGSTIN